jgi:hypothetical protein
MMQLIFPTVQDMLGTLPPGERDGLLALIARAAAGAGISMRADGPAP